MRNDKPATERLIFIRKSRISACTIENGALHKLYKHAFVSGPLEIKSTLTFEFNSIPKSVHFLGS
jgi:hypothetical protein